MAISWRFVHSQTENMRPIEDVMFWMQCVSCFLVWAKRLCNPWYRMIAYSSIWGPSRELSFCRSTLCYMLARKFSTWKCLCVGFFADLLRVLYGEPWDVYTFVSQFSAAAIALCSAFGFYPPLYSLKKVPILLHQCFNAAIRLDVSFLMKSNQKQSITITHTAKYHVSGLTACFVHDCSTTYTMYLKETTEVSAAAAVQTCPILYIRFIRENARVSFYSFSLSLTQYLSVKSIRCK